MAQSQIQSFQTPSQDWDFQEPHPTCPTLSGCHSCSGKAYHTLPVGHTLNSQLPQLPEHLRWNYETHASTWKRFVVFVCHLMTLHSNGCCMGFRSQSTEKCLRTCVCVLGGEERAACQVWEFWTVQSYFQAVFPSWGFRNSKLILRISVKFLALQWSGLSFL